MKRRSWFWTLYRVVTDAGAAYVRKLGLGREALIEEEELFLDPCKDL